MPRQALVDLLFGLIIVGQRLEDNEKRKKVEDVGLRQPMTILSLGGRRVLSFAGLKNFEDGTVRGDRERRRHDGHHKPHLSRIDDRQAQSEVDLLLSITAACIPAGKVALRRWFQRADGCHFTREKVGELRAGQDLFRHRFRTCVQRFQEQKSRHLEPKRAANVHVRTYE